jgi:putative peptidoglycan binding protein/peptidase M23-like protein
VSFSLDISHPIPAGFERGLGGPHGGTHVSPHWYIEWGNDLGAPPGTEIVAAFDCHLTKVVPHDPAADTAKVYGAQLFMRSANDMMGAFFTHLTDVPAELRAGSVVRRGQRLGTVLFRAGTAPHLHLAMVEILGGVPAGGSAPEANYRGFSLYDRFTTMSAGDVLSVEFSQDGNAPTVNGGGGEKPDPPGTIDLTTTLGVQLALIALGYNPGVADGIDGPNTRAAVRAFQADHGLAADGIVGPNTRAALASALSALSDEEV